MLPFLSVIPLCSVEFNYKQRVHFIFSYNLLCFGYFGLFSFALFTMEGTVSVKKSKARKKAQIKQSVVWLIKIKKRAFLAFVYFN